MADPNDILVRAAYGSTPVIDTKPGISSNIYEARTGAARYGIARFLINDGLRSQLRPCDTLALTVPIPGRLPTEPAGDIAVNIGLTYRAALPVVSSTPYTGARLPEPQLNNDLSEIVCFDDRNRGWNVAVITVYYNMWNPATEAFDANTLNGSNEWTWAEVCDDLGINYDAASVFPNFKPRNLAFENIPLARAIDMICARTYTVAGFDLPTGVVVIYSVGGETEANRLMFNRAARYILNDGSSLRNPATTPRRAQVSFRKLNLTDGDLYSDRFFTVTGTDVTNPLGTDDVLTIQMGTRFWTEAADEPDLTSVANEIIQKAFNFLNQNVVSYKLPGFWAFELDGKWRNIRYEFNHEGAFTIIGTSNVSDFEFNGSAAPNSFAFNYEFLGLGDTQVMSTPSGERVVFDDSNSDDRRLGFWGRVTGNAFEAVNRWTYTFEEVEKTGAGYDEWTAVAGGTTGTCYNSIEDMNTALAAHVEGNGINVDHLDTVDWTFAIIACPTDNIIWIHKVTFGATTEYWFSYENGVDGVCD